MVDWYGGAVTTPDTDHTKPSSVSPRVQTLAGNVLLVVFAGGLSAVMLVATVVVIHYLIAFW